MATTLSSVPVVPPDAVVTMGAVVPVVRMELVPVVTMDAVVPVVSMMPTLPLVPVVGGSFGLSLNL